MDGPTAISTAAAIIVAIVIPLFGYVLKGKDVALKELEGELKDARKDLTLQAVSITRLEGQAQVWATLHVDLRELRDVMVPRAEWVEQMSNIRSEIRELRASLRPGSYRMPSSDRDMQAIKPREPR